MPNWNDLQKLRPQRGAISQAMGNDYSGERSVTDKPAEEMEDDERTNRYLELIRSMASEGLTNMLPVGGAGIGVIKGAKQLANIGRMADNTVSPGVLGAIAFNQGRPFTAKRIADAKLGANEMGLDEDLAALILREMKDLPRGR